MVDCSGDIRGSIILNLYSILLFDIELGSLPYVSYHSARKQSSHLLVDKPPAISANPFQSSLQLADILDARCILQIALMFSISLNPLIQMPMSCRQRICSGYRVLGCLGKPENEGHGLGRGGGRDQILSY